MSDKYILNGREAVPCNDLLTWARWYETADRVVKQEKLGDIKISTVFLGLNHNNGEGPPLLFEAMVFGGPLAQEMDRCATWKEAEAMHQKMVERVRVECSAT